MRTRIVAVIAVFLILAVWGVGRATLSKPSTVNRYTVIDGDTFVYYPKDCMLTAVKLGCFGQRLRLEGVDAFESKQTCRDALDQVWRCGAAATARLKEFVNRSDFACRIDPEFLDRHAREFAVCFAGGRDVGATLVREGLAFAYGRDTQYVPLEQEAKDAHRGAWAGHFVRPQYFRQGATG